MSYIGIKNSMASFERVPVKPKSRKPKQKRMVEEDSEFFNTKAIIKPLDMPNWAQSMLEDRKKYGS